MRLFVAVNLPERTRGRLYEAAEPLRSADLPVRWVAQEALHVTLKFLGETSPDRVEAIEEALAGVAGKSKPLELELGGFGAFPSLRKPRVLWSGAYASPELRCLKHDVEWGLAGLGFEREARAFHPHITLGRATQDARAGDFRDLEDLVATLRFDSEIAVSSLELMRSILSPKGARYEPLASLGLGQATPEQAG